MKRKKILVSICCLAMLLLIGCNTERGSAFEKNEAETVEFDLNSAEKIIREITNRFTEAHITRDTAFLNNCFTEDARVYPPNSEVVTGKADIARLNYEWVSYDIHEFREVSTSFYGNEEYLIDEGTYSLSYGEGPVTDKGKYVNIWKNENGTWKIFSNIWNTSLPFDYSE